MLSDAEILSVKKLCPKLELIKRKGKYLVTGELDFCASYDSKSDTLTINPSQAAVNDNFIEDKFRIEMELLPDFPKSLPCVREVGGRINRIVKKFAIKNICDLHTNKNRNNAICVCPEPARLFLFKNGNVEMPEFIKKLVIPYFYGLSYYEKHGHWPWGEYSHGPLGIFEYYFEQMQGKTYNEEVFEVTLKSLTAIDERITKSITREIYLKIYAKCPCGSGFEFKHCHFPAYQGVKLLQIHYKLHMTHCRLLDIIEMQKANIS